MSLNDRRADRPDKADRIDADMAAETPVFGGDERGAHFRRDLVVG